MKVRESRINGRKREREKKRKALSAVRVILIARVKITPDHRE